MDERKLNTTDLLAMGITSMPKPQTDIPEDRPQGYYSLWADEGDEDRPTRERLIERINAGEVFHCSEYYGIPYVWREGDKYRGNLLQYRNVTENPTFDTVEEAVDWFIETAEKCEG